ncbi:MAG: adenylyltransferase/cytidyltransferase family protein [Lachnospiraceae bacterium]|nr:adenylyltransferase/cytidyltransferase family protein [Lachnospiraceae bacterium]
MRPYRLGLVLGRFQGLHIGHEAVIRKALSVCDKVIVMIGSADKAGTAHDPFTAALRQELLAAVFPRLTKSGRVILVPLNDLGVGNVPAWGDYVIANAKKAVGVPECIVYGDEDKCRTWFPNYPEIRYISLNRAIIDVNATKLRKIILEGDEEAYKKYTAKGLHKYFPQLREILCGIAAGGDDPAASVQQNYACGNKQ